MGNYFNEKLETMSRDEMLALQSRRLVDTVRRVYDHVAPYRAKMDAIGLKPEDIRSVDDLSKLPFTTKQDLRDNYPYGMFAVPQSEVAEIHASSGTTGKQTVVGYTAKDLQTWGEISARAIVAAERMTFSTFPTATACSPAVWVSTTAAKKWGRR